ncbi:MAG TPA: anthranilate phosphoribosyltransferase [Acidimicrobiales bacterium]|nr:anthranilate phosphoribosyltransferase [Acidimicrobiales bacterium]
MGLAIEAVGGWPAVLRPLMAGEDLPAEDAAAALTDILEGEATPAQIAAFITLMRAKGETVEEMTALVRTMLRFAEPIPMPDGVEVLDTCGSGGSEQRRQGAFNVSTITALVVAGAGVAVAKHGGRAASATSSSADVLAALGVTVELGPAGVARCVQEAGMGFCFAPRFHPAMRFAAPVRRELGVPTLFNFVAPMANPARPRRQVLGVSEPRLAETMLAVLHRNGATDAMVVHGDDGLDELTTTTTSTVLEVREDGEVRRYTVDATELGLARAAPADLRGGDAAANAELARRVLDGKHGPHRDIVALNAAAGLVVAGVVGDLAAGVERACVSIDSGQAAGVLDRLVAVSAAAAAAGD